MSYQDDFNRRMRGELPPPHQMRPGHYAADAEMRRRQLEAQEHARRAAILRRRMGGAVPRPRRPQPDRPAASEAEPSAISDFLWGLFGPPVLCGLVGGGVAWLSDADAVRWAAICGGAAFALLLVIVVAADLISAWRSRAVASRRYWS